jgi:uncharacterized membrane protein HdeD (DUF308 family)
VALLIVCVAMIAGTAFQDRAADRQWPAVAAPVIPAVYLLAAFFTGGFHGMTLPRYQALAAIFCIALLSWWAVIEGCRQIWKRLRSDTHAPSA